MSAPAAKPASAPAPTAPAPYVRAKRPRVDWKAVWPIPLAVTSAAALVGGLFLAVARAPKDDPGVPLAHARDAYRQDKYIDVIEIINADLVPYINAGKLSEEQEKEFFQLRARSLFYGQERMGIVQAENFKAIVEAYEQGKRRGMALEPADIGNLAEAYLHAGDVTKGVQLARSLEGRDEQRQIRLYERIIEHQLRAGSTQYPVVLGLLNEMLQMPGISLAQRAWVVSRQAQLRLEAGFPQEAITRLLREMPKFESLDRSLRGQLLFLLGKAYADGVDDQQAVTYLEQAMRAILDQEGADPDPQAQIEINNFDPRVGEALVIQGRIFARNGQVEAARERFQTVREGFKDSTVYTQAVLGEADTAAELGDHEAALRHYGEAAERIAAGSSEAVLAGITPVTLDLIGTRLMDQYERRWLENDPKEALKFVRKAQEVYKRRGSGTVPSDVYIAMAKACRLNADILLREASGTPAGEPAPRPDEVSLATATEAKGYLLDAGQNYRDFARDAVVSSPDASLQALLAAGECFDQAGSAPDAIEAYEKFIKDTSDNTIDKPKAIYSLGQVYQSIGNFKAAAQHYERLVMGRESFSGPWADRSLVPLARCYVADPSTVSGGTTDKPEGAAADRSTDKPNEVAAIMLLNRAIGGRTGIGPDAPQMREAQVELGEIHYRRGDFRQAIEYFNRLVDTYRDQTPRLPTVLFKRADAHRQIAMAIEATFDQRPMAERQELSEAKRNHLRDARAGYAEAVAAIVKRGGRATRTERLFHRNAAFYIADCAYQLKEYEQAVQEYARASEQYASDPASLVAKVQTVNCFIRLQRWDDAQVAAERAKTFLSSFPDDVWTKPGELLPMERRHWEAWLAARIELERRGASSVAGADAGP
ncbi:MAG TPA: tetratricopeptide repeat protein [Phycisphaerales bacterium]|nr:tetratricopeptide repeat protein [Phycisphaerales bacterium]